MQSILVVEDDPATARAIAAELTGHGHAVRQAITGAEAIEAAIAHHFDAITLTVCCPISMAWWS